VTRFTDQGRDLSKPLVEVGESASLRQRVGGWLLRGYLVFAAFVAVLAGVVTLVWIFIGSD
jgi:hypothetical protein